MARGIDVPEVDIVINFDLPFTETEGWKEPDYANYLHRVGRTGRFGTDGLGITFVSPESADIDMLELNFLKKIEKFYSSEIKEIKTFEEFIQIYREMRCSSDDATV